MSESAGPSKKGWPRFEMFEHTADMGLRAYGRTLEEAFENAAYGMFSLIAPEARVECRETRSINVEGADLDSLLVNWLSDLLYIFEADRFLPGRFQVMEIGAGEKEGKMRLFGSAMGEQVNPVRHRFEREVKAVTYHLLKVERLGAVERLEASERGAGCGITGAPQWYIQVILDL